MNHILSRQFYLNIIRQKSEPSHLRVLLFRSPRGYSHTNCRPDKCFLAVYTSHVFVSQDRSRTVCGAGVRVEASQV